MPEQINDYSVVVFGAGGVGKTSLVLRFINGTFGERYVPTVEDTYRKVVNSDKNVCTLQITDTAGSHHFPAMQKLSITKGKAFVLVYSITTRQSIEELKPVYEQICLLKENLENVPVLLVGNKCDEIDRKVSTEEGEDLARLWKIVFLETSAKNNHNVTELFDKLLRLEKGQTLTLIEEGDKNSETSTSKIKGKCVIH